MMPRSRIFQAAAALALAAALLGPLAASAAAGGDAGRRGREGRLQQELGLSDDQVQALRQAREGQADTLRQHVRARRQAEAELRRLVLQGTDDGAVRAQAAEVQRLAAEAVELRIMRLRELSAVLTPEQRERLAGMKPPFHRHPRGRPAAAPTS
jgi:Spy/CpxP family protein refolding chaperone